jgi:nucleotide-binding universal stress UspA family protein
MLKPVQSILFATDLSTNCQQALEFVISVGTRFQATIYMLHVLEALPENVEGHLKNLLGRHQWSDIVHSHQSQAHKSLTGKISTNSRVRQEIQKFCQEAGINEKTCDFQSQEIIISDGDVAESIIKHALENDCDLIVLGAKRGLFHKISLGTTTKEVLKNGKVAVTVVPPADQAG